MDNQQDKTPKCNIWLNLKYFLNYFHISIIFTTEVVLVCGLVIQRLTCVCYVRKVGAKLHPKSSWKLLVVILKCADAVLIKS